jgi:hypothetical protein
MAKAVKKSRERVGGKAESLPLGRKNFMIIGAGVLVIAAGYLAMSEGSVEGFLPITLAPILLVIGYCIVIPVGILYRDGMFPRRKAEGSSPTPAT